MEKLKIGGVFPNEEVFDKIYEECSENAPYVPDAVRESYAKMRNSFEEYLCALEEYMFRYAYEFGYKAGMEAAFGKNGHVA